MEDSYLIANYHALCRLCLNKSNLMISIFGPAPDDDINVPLTSKVAECFEIQMDPNDGLPNKICYKCLCKLQKCSKFKIQCLQNESRLRQITGVAELDHSNSSNNSNYLNSLDQHKIKGGYIVEDSVVMVVDPSLDYNSSDESETIEPVETVERNITPDGETLQESFFKSLAMCIYCDRAFVTQDKCREHEISTHDPNLPYKCVECSLVFAQRSQHIQHNKQVHGNDKPYNCTECEKCFGRRSDLRKHSIVHTGVRPYQCHYCLKSFSRNTNLSKHLRIHAGMKPHVCPLCPRSFVAKGDLQRHVVIHSRKKPFACKKCPMTFGRRDKLLKHEIRHDVIQGKTLKFDNEQDNNDMIVNVNPFSNILSLPTSKNMETDSLFDLPRVPDHISGENSFINQMSKSTTSGKSVPESPTKKVVSSKNKPKNIKCHQCPKRFSSLDAYKTHVSVAHIGSIVFQCKICFKKFSRKRELDRHVSMHNEALTFSCSQCDKTFNNKDKLDVHQKTQECLVVNMPCIECGATFERKVDLVAHIKSHFSDNFEEKSSETDKKENVPDSNDFPLDENLYDLET